MWSRRVRRAPHRPRLQRLDDILEGADTAEDVPDEMRQHGRLSGDQAVGRDLSQLADVRVGEGKRRWDCVTMSASST